MRCSRSEYFRRRSREVLVFLVAWGVFCTPAAAQKCSTGWSLLRLTKKLISQAGVRTGDAVTRPNGPPPPPPEALEEAIAAVRMMSVADSQTKNRKKIHDALRLAEATSIDAVARVVTEIGKFPHPSHFVGSEGLLAEAIGTTLLNARNAQLPFSWSTNTRGVEKMLLRRIVQTLDTSHPSVEDYEVAEKWARALKNFAAHADEQNVRWRTSLIFPDGGVVAGKAVDVYRAFYRDHQNRLSLERLRRRHAQTRSGG